MSHVVTSYQWTWKRVGGHGYKGDAGEEVCKWIAEMSEKGWELKGFTSMVAPKTLVDDSGIPVEMWTAYYTAIMQRPNQIADVDDGWEYPD